MCQAKPTVAETRLDKTNSAANKLNADAAAYIQGLDQGWAESIRPIVTNAEAVAAPPAIAVATAANLPSIVAHSIRLAMKREFAGIFRWVLSRHLRAFGCLAPIRQPRGEEPQRRAARERWQR